MDFNEEKDQNFIKIKDKLNENKIKLWLPPYMGINEKKDWFALKKLADSFSEQLVLPNEVCLRNLEKLQAKALKNFKHYDRYLSTGEATLRVKIFNEVGEALITVTMDLTRTGYDLKLRVCRQASIIPLRMRMIFRGKFLQDDLVLQDQNIKHGLHIISVALKPSCEGLYLEYEADGRGVKTVSDIVLLSKKGYLQNQEQFKKLADLPVKERKFLIGGMRFHQIGRAYMKKGNYASALAMLLEAEENFGHYESNFMESFSNYAFLNLDIVWCYLNLQCLVLLPDAGERLTHCEREIKKVYGKNLERVAPGTDFRWTTLILFMRLRLLQAAVLYHRNRTYRAGFLLKRAEKELRSLRVNNRHLTHLIRLGYRRAEARFALREAKGDINKAIHKIEKKRIEMTNKLFELVKKGQYLLKSDLPERESSNARREATLYKSLISMGCSEEICKRALEQRRIIDSVEDSSEEEESEDSGDENNGNGAVCLKTVITIGFQPKKARDALRRHGGDFDAAVRELFKKEFLLGYESYIEIDAGRTDNIEEDNEVTTSTNVNDPARAFSFEFREPVTCAQLYPEKPEYIQYDYIDTALTLELTLIQKYKGLLKKVKEQQAIE